MKRLSLPFARDLARRGAFGLLDILSARTIQFRLDVVIDPFLVPPFDRENRQAVQVDAKMKMVADGKPGFAGFADGLLLLDGIAHFDVDGA